MRCLILLGLFLLISKGEFLGPNQFARFEVQIKQMNGELLKGYLVAEEQIDTCSSTNFQNWILSNQGDYTRCQTLWICTEQSFFKHPYGDSISFSYCAAFVEVDKKEILSIDKLKAIKGVDQSMRQKITYKEKEFFQRTPLAQLNFSLEGEMIHDSGGDYFVDYWLLSYNQEVGEAQLKDISYEIAQEYLKTKEGLKWYEQADSWNSIYQMYRNELLIRDVVFLEIGGM